MPETPPPNPAAEQIVQILRERDGVATEVRTRSGKVFIIYEKFKAHRELFARDRQGVGSFVFVKAKLDKFEKPLVRAQFSGGKENAVYLYDPLLSHNEKLYTLHGIRGTSIREYQKALWPVVLSEQVVGYGRKDFIGPEFLLSAQNGLTIRVATYGTKNTLAMKKLTSLAFKMIAFYEPFLGPFPFKEFNIIEINEYGFGQAPPATMFITKEAFNPVEDEVSRIFSKGINHRFAHEIAHQYWGHVVKMGSFDEQWITESFAEYSSSFIVKFVTTAEMVPLLQLLTKKDYTSFFDQYYWGTDMP